MSRTEVQLELLRKWPEGSEKSDAALLEVACRVQNGYEKYEYRTRLRSERKCRQRP